jgi:hypothetical protein
MTDPDRCRSNIERSYINAAPLISRRKVSAAHIDSSIGVPPGRSCQEELSMTGIRKAALATAAVAFSLVSIGRIHAASDTPMEGKKAFELLKSLAGQWTDKDMKPADGTGASIQFMVASGGTVVEEVQFPGSPHEMRSLYYMDGSELVMTHYCGIGNQPHMRLDGAKSSPSQLVFDFVSGTNMDPAKDTHVHSGWIKPEGGDHLEAEWTVFSAAKPAGSHHFSLTRNH